ncbi:MAG: hypothetical protein F6K21_05800 [Symploca sp. SIO2D2]|nr:hypothetical protein [Symploca sp. SIO2D2]
MPKTRINAAFVLTFKKQGRRQRAEGRRKDGFACLFHLSRVAIAASGVALQKLKMTTGWLNTLI